MMKWFYFIEIFIIIIIRKKKKKKKKNCKRVTDDELPPDLVGIDIFVISSVGFMFLLFQV